MTLRAPPMVLALLSGGLAVSACSGDAGERAAAAATRDTSATGVVTVSYAQLPDHPVHVLTEDLRIGSVDGSDGVAFGDEGPSFDVFTGEGEFVGRQEAAFAVLQYYPPLVKQGWLLTVQADPFDVQYVVGARLPW